MDSGNPRDTSNLTEHTQQISNTRTTAILQGQPAQNQLNPALPAQNQQRENQQVHNPARETLVQNNRAAGTSRNTAARIETTRNTTTRATAVSSDAVDENTTERADRAKKVDRSEKKDKTEAVVTITAKEEFENILKNAGDKYIMVEFYATWCGPCRMLSVKLEELANLYIDKAIIVKIDVDDFEDIAIEYNVTSMPAFMILKNKQKVEHFVGSKVEQLENALEKFVGKPT